MYEIMMIVYLVVAVTLIGFILVQQGKGAGMGSSFGAGASGTVFGAAGSGNFLTKSTTVLAIVFFGVALALGNLTTEKSASTDEDDLFADQATEVVSPAKDIPAENASDELPTVDTNGDLPTEDSSLNVETPTTDEAAATDIPEETKEDSGTN